MTAPHLHDLLVAGAGVSGLTAAALAAAEGFDTVVLEAHNRPGGCAGDFALGGLLFPAGATLFSGFEPGGLHDRVLRRLGIPNRALPLAQAMTVVSPERRFTFWTDRQQWEAEWRATFDGDRAGIARFFRWAERLGGIAHRMAVRLPVLPPRTARDGLRLAAALRPETLRALPYLVRAVGDVLRDLAPGVDPLFRRFIDAQLLDATGCTAASAGALHGALALDLYHRGCFALPGGPGTLAHDLVLGLRRHGGVLHYQSTAERLRRGADGAWHCWTADGRHLRARAVISSLPPWNTATLLSEQAPRRLRRTRGLHARGWGAVLLHAGVDPGALPAAPFSFAQVLPEAEVPLTEGRMCFISVLPQRRAGGPRPVSVSTHTDLRRWQGLDRDAYERQKAGVTERLLDAGERAFPGFRDALCFHAAATPRTFARYTGRGGGAVGGLPNDVRHGLLGALSIHSGAPGLWLCGDNVFPGQGTLGVTLSAITAWRAARDTLGAGRR